MIDGLGQTGIHTLITLGTDAALQAPFGLSSGPLLGEAQGHFLISTADFIQVPGRHGLTGFLNLSCGFRLDKGPVFLPVGPQVLLIQITVDAFRRLFAAGYGFDHGFRPVEKVAAGKNPGQVCLQGQGIGFDPPSGGELQTLSINLFQIGLLADGHNGRIRFPGNPALFVIAGVKAFLVIKDGQAFLEGYPREGSPFFGKLQGAPAVFNNYPFGQGLFDFIFPGRHFLTLFQTNQPDLFGPLAQGGQGYVDGYISATDDQGLFSHPDVFPKGGRAEEIYTLQDMGEVFTRHPQAPALVQAQGQINRLEALVLQVVQGKILTEGYPGLHFHSQVFDNLNFGLQGLPGQAVGRNAHGHHPPQDGQLLKDGYLVAFLGQIIGAGQAGRTAPDDCHLLRTGLGRFGHITIGCVQIQVGHKALQIFDGQGLVHQTAGAFGLAGVMADPAANGRKGHFLLNQFQGLLIPALGDECDKALNADMGRTGSFTGSRTPFLDGKGTGHSLGIQFIGGLAGTEFLIKLVGQINGADLSAFSAGRAF